MTAVGVLKMRSMSDGSKPPRWTTRPAGVEATAEEARTAAAAPAPDEEAGSRVTAGRGSIATARL